MAAVPAPLARPSDISKIASMRTGRIRPSSHAAKRANRSRIPWGPITPGWRTAPQLGRERAIMSSPMNKLRAWRVPYIQVEAEVR
jgi:hypothetical protein